MTKRNDKKKVPELRFRGFTDPWEQRQLGEVVSERNERSASGELLSISMSRGVYPTSCSDRKDNSSEDKSNYKHLAVGDIAYNSMRMWQGACGLSSFDGIISPAYTVVIPSAATDGRFLIDLFKTTEMLNTFQRNSQGLTSDTWNLKYPAFSKIKCSIPSLHEQRLIGQFFSTLDSLIAAAERQEALLRQKKQAYLQLMFPQEGETQPRLRFSGFSGDWEQRQSSELFVPVKENGHSDLPVLSATQSEGMVYRDDQSRDIKFKKDNLGSYRLVRAGDFVISLRSFQGGFELSDKTGIVSPAYTVFTHAECSSQDNGYWKQYFKRRSFIESLKTVTFGIRDGKAISFSDFSSLKCIFPTLPEQRLIGRFFSTLDSLIAAAEERTRALKEMKSAYLQRMFV